MTLFRYDQEIADRFPGIFGGVLHAEGVRNGPSPPELAEAFAAEQRAVLERLGDTPLSEVPSLAAWRRAFRAFGVDPTAYRSAAEALLRRLTKQGSIASINTLVDIGNLVSIRYGLPVAMFDLASISGGLTVRLATGDESFTDLGSGATERRSPARSSSSTSPAMSPRAAGAGDSRQRARVPDRPPRSSSPSRDTTTRRAGTSRRPSPTSRPCCSPSRVHRRSGPASSMPSRRLCQTTRARFGRSGSGAAPARARA